MCNTTNIQINNHLALFQTSDDIASNFNQIISTLHVLEVVEDKKKCSSILAMYLVSSLVE